MFTISEELQRARLDQGIDLATVAARTKIRTKFLRAIDAEDPKALPGQFLQEFCSAVRHLLRGGHESDRP